MFAIKYILQEKINGLFLKVWINVQSEKHNLSINLIRSKRYLLEHLTVKEMWEHKSTR